MHAALRSSLPCFVCPPLGPTNWKRALTTAGGRKTDPAPVERKVETWIIALFICPEVKTNVVVECFSISVECKQLIVDSWYHSRANIAMHAIQSHSVHSRGWCSLFLNICPSFRDTWRAKTKANWLKLKEPVGDVLMLCDTFTYGQFQGHNWYSFETVFSVAIKLIGKTAKTKQPCCCTHLQRRLNR